MTEYRLVGFASFVFNAPGFLVPLFMSRGSNGVFSHLLDENFNIERFFWIDPNEYFLEDLTDDDTYAVGKAGVLCFRTLQGDMYFGSSSKVKKGLLSLDIDASCDEFSMIDVYSFLGDEERKNNAIDRAAQLFRDPMISESWKLQQLGKGVEGGDSGFSGIMSFPVGQREEILKFAGDLGGRGWITRWLSYWKTAENKDFLVRLAMDWFERVGHIEGQTPVYRCLLSHEDSYLVAMESLVDWLHHNGWGFAGWGRLWCVGFEAARADSKAERMLYEMGNHYVVGDTSWVRGDRKNKAHLADVNSWCSVWSHVTYGSSSLEEMHMLRLFQLSGIYGKNKVLWKRALEPSLEKNIGDKEFREILYTHMRSSNFNNGWVRLYGWLLSNGEDISQLEDRVSYVFESDICSQGIRYDLWRILYNSEVVREDYFNFITEKYLENFPADRNMELVKYFNNSK